jgi:hypothetical protein
MTPYAIIVPCFQVTRVPQSQTTDPFSKWQFAIQLSEIKTAAECLSS